jgi:predicted RNase H-like nuclease (RuvC/YqgF family)
MSALDRLKEKVDAWKLRIEELEQDNKELRKQVDHTGAGNSDEVDDLRVQLEACQNTVTELRNDIAEKDLEIDAIIAKVEALID